MLVWLATFFQFTLLPFYNIYLRTLDLALFPWEQLYRLGLDGGAQDGAEPGHGLGGRTDADADAERTGRGHREKHFNS